MGIFCENGNRPMPTIKFTDRSLKALKPPAEGRVEYWDVENPGLGLRVSDKGRKSWVVMYRHNGRQRRLTLGVYPHLTLADARKKAKDAMHGVAHGADPAAVKQADRKAENFSELADLYLERHAKPNKRTWKTDERIINVELSPIFGRHKVKDVRRRDVISLLDGIVDRGSPIMANRTLELIRKIFNFAISRDIAEFNPCQGVGKPSAETRRERVLDAGEIRRFWEALDQEPLTVASAFRLLLLTAQRKSEVLRLRWSDIDLGAGWWVIPPEFSKNGRAHRVPLSEPAIKIIRELQADARHPVWILPSEVKDQPIAIFTQMLQRIRDRSSVANFTVHDLRRSAASHMTGMGINRLVVTKLLNHAEPGVTATYDRHSYDREKREALDAWGRRLMEIVTGKTAPSNVVPLSDAGATG
jgi:integrase